MYMESWHDAKITEKADEEVRVLMKMEGTKMGLASGYEVITGDVGGGASDYHNSWKRWISMEEEKKVVKWFRDELE